MKKRIRLTESKLRRLIESTINEMNWKTYANASRKRGEQANYAAANSLSNAAAGAFNDQYGDEDFEMDGVTSNGLEGRYDSMSHWGMDNDRGFYGDDWDDVPFDSLDGDYPGRDDAARYVSGKSRYEKGRGWQNESRRRAVNYITESVMRRLRRN